MGETGQDEAGQDAAGQPEPRRRAWGHGVRDRVRSHPVGWLVWRIVIGIVGLALVVGGLILVPLPGPGWLIVILGLVVLASEFSWAESLLHRLRAVLGVWTGWISRQSWPVRCAVGLATAIFVGLVLWGVFAVIGVPGWFPAAWVPPLPGL